MSDLEILNTQLLDVLRLHNIPPPPPEHLQRRVVGGYFSDFISSPGRTVDVFKKALSDVGTTFGLHSAVLDFGVGCGRMLRWLATTYPSLKLTGIDIDDEAIDWLRQNYSRFGQFEVAPHHPPTNLPSGAYDIIYGISVFTHLPHTMQFAWLEELKRLARPGGHVLLSVRDAPDTSSNEVKAAISSGGIAVTGDTTDGLPAFYRTTYHSRAYIEREWSRYFQVLKFIPKALDWATQDLVVLRNN